MASPVPAKRRRLSTATAQAAIRVVSILATVICAAGGLGLAALYMSRGESELNRWVLHTHNVLRSLENINGSSAAAESAVRGFFLTSGKEFRDRFDAAAQRLRESAARVRELTADNASQQHRMNALEPLLFGYLNGASARVEDHAQSELSDAEQSAVTSSGARMLMELRRLISELTQAEEELLERRVRESRSHGMWSGVALGGLTGLMLLASVICMYAFRDARQADQHRQMNAELEQRVQQRTAELQRAKDELDRFFSVSIDLLCICGFDGRFRKVNPAWQQVLGYELDELLSRPFLDFVHPDDIPATRVLFERLLKGGITRAFENRYRRHDGQFRWLMWTAVVVPGIDMVYAIARDITERREFEQRLACLAAIVDGREEAILSSTREAVVASWNLSAERLLGYRASEILGQPRSVLVPLDRRDHEAQLFERVLRGEAVSAEETVRTRCDGREIHVRVAYSPLRDAAGRIIGLSEFLEAPATASRFEQVPSTTVDLHPAKT